MNVDSIKFCLRNKELITQNDLTQEIILLFALIKLPRSSLELPK